MTRKKGKTKKGELRPLNPPLTPTESRVWDDLSHFLSPQQIRSSIKESRRVAEAIKEAEGLGFSFTDTLKLVLKRGPGRPRLWSLEEIMQEYEEIVPEDRMMMESRERAWRRQRQHQGRPSDKTRNQSLLEGWRAAKSQGMTMRAFVKKWLRAYHGREATPDDVDDIRTVERRLNRLLKK
jgi:hypothetical protein